MSRPLALPSGSIRALLLLALAARAILDLTHDGDIAAWLAAALLVSAAAYFGHRAAAPRRSAAATTGEADGEARGGRDPTPPLGLPAGTVRTIFLFALAYGTWLWLDRHHGLAERDYAVASVLLAFIFGIVIRWIVSRLKGGGDAGTLAFEHGQAFVALVSAAGLVVFASTGRPLDGPSWVEPALASVCAYYAGAR